MDGLRCVYMWKDGVAGLLVGWGGVDSLLHHFTWGQRVPLLPFLMLSHYLVVAQSAL